MAESAPVNAELLEWPKEDKRRFRHVVYRVGDLDRTIKFYTECFGMKLLGKRDVPEEKYSIAFLGFGPAESHFVVALTYNYGVNSNDIGTGCGNFAIATPDVSKMVEYIKAPFISFMKYCFPCVSNYGVHSYDIGTGCGNFTIATPDVYKMVEYIKAKGGTVTREPGPVEGGTTVIAFVKDPDGYIFELIQRGRTPEPLCQVMLRVGDLERSIKFYEKALGMKLLTTKANPEYKYTLAVMGYADEYETTVLGLAYNHGVTEDTKGNAYAQIAISTDDVYKSGEVVKLVTEELGGKITKQPGPIPGLNTKITSFLDPDGWKIVLIDNEDFLKKLQ